MAESVFLTQGEKRGEQGHGEAAYDDLLDSYLNLGGGESPPPESLPERPLAESSVLPQNPHNSPLPRTPDPEQQESRGNTSDSSSVAETRDGEHPSVAGARSGGEPERPRNGDDFFDDPGRRAHPHDRFFVYEEYDVEKIAAAIDGHTSTLKRQLMEEFLAAKETMFLKYRDALDAENHHSRSRLAYLTDREADLSHDNAKMKIFIDRLVHERSLRRDRLVHTVFLRSVFATWRENVHWTRRLLALSERARLFYRRALLKRAFRAWQRHTQLGTRQKLNRKWQLKLQEATNTIVEQYELELGNTRSQLENAEAHIERSGQDRAVFQQQMKRSFMRGVCALNLETMGVLRPSPDTVAATLERDGPEVGSITAGLESFVPGTIPVEYGATSSLGGSSSSRVGGHSSHRRQQHHRPTAQQRGETHSSAPSRASRGSATVYASSNNGAHHGSSRSRRSYQPERVANPTLKRTAGPRKVSTTPAQHFVRRE
jgi:hypothetical protein